MAHPAPGPMAWRLAGRSAAVVAARLRFALAVGGLLGLIALWPALQAGFERLTTRLPAGGPVSADTEYWCPMCPGVVSDWPAKCPVCNMALVRRQKGEMTPQPDGAVARVQLSPYRVQLAGLHTAPVEFRRLESVVLVGGLLDPPPGSAVTFSADVFEPDASALAVGQTGTLTTDAAPDELLTARIADIAPAASPEAGRKVRVRVDDPHGGLRPGTFVAATFRTPLAAFASSRRVEQRRWAEQTAVAQLAGPDFALPVLADAVGRQTAAAAGLTLCVPEMAVIDTGTRRVVYVEAMPGVYDAVEVTLGRRCGDHYPVRDGLEPGQRVVTAGAILLDAESRLNPSVAAGYFGAGGRPASTAPAQPKSPPADDATLIAEQKVCPVTGDPLGSMGPPVKVMVAGKPVFICCKGCEKPLLKDPAKHLATLPK